jgi:hypothetical protein
MAALVGESRLVADHIGLRELPQWFVAQSRGEVLVGGDCLGDVAWTPPVSFGPCPPDSQTIRQPFARGRENGGFSRRQLLAHRGFALSGWKRVEKRRVDLKQVSVLVAGRRYQRCFPRPAAVEEVQRA